MRPRRVVLDTNVYVDWLNHRRNESLVLGRESVRVMSAVVGMELRLGAITLPARRALDQLLRGYREAGRLVAPTANQLDRAGTVLQRLRASGHEVRRASLVHDVLIALTARDLGARVVTADRDFDVIRTIVDVDVQLVTV